MLKRQVEEFMKTGVSREEVFCLSKCMVGLNHIAARLRLIWTPPVVEDTIPIKEQK